MEKLTSVKNIRDPYIKRILSNIIGKDVLKVLSQTPNKLKRRVAELSENKLHIQPEPNKWSIAQIITHLSDCEIVFGYRVRMIIAQPGSTLLSFDEKAWSVYLAYDKADCWRKLGLFAVLRHDNLQLLKSLTPKQWKQYGLHSKRGKETIERMTQLYAGHDINHLKQIDKIRKMINKNLV